VRAHTFRDLDRPTETDRFAALSAEEASRQNRARRGSLAHATLARSALSTRDLEAAASAASTTVGLAAAVKSHRSTAAVNDLRVRMTEHKASPAVREFYELADALVPQWRGVS
jgi:hypothetical protein